MAKILTSFALALCFKSIVLAECAVSYDVLYEIATNERHPKRAIGYPFKISFNVPSESNLVSKEHEALIERLDGRTIDCKSVETCVTVADHLLKNGATSLDLGPFQANSKYYLEEDLSIYFILPRAYAKACRTLEILAKRHGWSWRTIGQYHSGTPGLNSAYVEKIQKRITNNSYTGVTH